MEVIMRLLSIDFDYFIDTDLKTRDNKFPDGVDEKPKMQLECEWNYFYNTYPELNDLEVIEECDTLCRFLEHLERGKVLVAYSHKDIEKLFPLVMSAEELEVVHIDFHHDNYISSGNTLDCANWLRHLMNRRDFNLKTEVLWIRREDSECESLEGVFPYPSTTEFNVSGEFDYIFLCFSPEWTPPHLRKEYETLRKCVSHLRRVL